jgi:hypothetical protein
MKEALIIAGIGFAVFQTILLLAILSAAARPIPRFEPEMKEWSATRELEEQREVELV